jgi:hypothetical protein
MLVASANFPSTAEAMPAMPKAKPKNRPAMGQLSATALAEML